MTGNSEDSALEQRCSPLGAMPEACSWGRRCQLPSDVMLGVQWGELRATCSSGVPEALWCDREQQ